MMDNIRKKTIGYQIWATSVAISAVYFLIKLCFFDITPFDRAVEVYALISLVINYIMVRGGKN
jgi:hypothetical protein